jgi:uncharacterized protein
MASKPWRVGRILFRLALLFWIGPAAAAEPNYPQLTGRIVDDANLLSPDERAAPNERKVRIEVGRGLEPILTDAMSKVVINGAILPRFRDGDYASGIKEGVKGIELLTGDATELAERVKGRHDADDPKIDWAVVIFWTVIILWFIWVSWRSSQSSAYRRGSGPIFVPGPQWGDSSGSDWSSGGGGFSGGGGSFGGGASGSW